MRMNLVGNGGIFGRFATLRDEAAYDGPVVESDGASGTTPLPIGT